jgi:hypothetical protein
MKMGMNVGELIEILEGMNEEAEVRLAFQPRWPPQYRVDRVIEIDPENVSVGDGDCEHVEFNDGECLYCGELEDEIEERREAIEAMGDEPVVYIGEGGQVSDSPYLPGIVASELGWRE